MGNKALTSYNPRCALCCVEILPDHPESFRVVSLDPALANLADLLPAWDEDNVIPKLRGDYRRLIFRTIHVGDKISAQQFKHGPACDMVYLVHCRCKTAIERIFPTECNAGLSLVIAAIAPSLECIKGPFRPISTVDTETLSLLVQTSSKRPIHSSFIHALPMFWRLLELPGEVLDNILFNLPEDQALAITITQDIMIT